MFVIRAEGEDMQKFCGAMFKTIDNVCCAVRYGHTRRDWQRVRLRRLILLAKRHIAHHRMQADIAACERNDFGATAAHLELALAQSFTDALKDMGNRVDSDAYRILLDKIEFHRFDLEASHMRARINLASLDSANGTARDASEIALTALSAKHYGNLYKGLRQRSIFDAFHDKFGFCIRYWHGFISKIWQVGKKKHSDVPP